MNKAKLIERVAKDLGCSKAGATRSVNAVLDAIRHGLRADRSVSLVGFGTFRVNHRRARRGVNPRTGQSIRIPATRNVSFRAGKDLKESV